MHNKQHVLDQLNEWKTVTVLNHPAIRNGYTNEDLGQLGNYDCMEVLSPSALSTSQWDAALSAGKSVFIVGNDDTHDVLSKRRLGKMCTFVHNPGGTGQGVLEALRSGRSYGMAIGENQHLDSIPHLMYVKIENDSICIKVSDNAARIIVRGQNGKTLKTGRLADYITFRLEKEDHYARAEFHYVNGTSMYLNPVFFTAESGYRAPRPSVNAVETSFYRFLGIALISIWLGLIWNLFRGNRQQRYRQGRLAFK